MLRALRITALLTLVGAVAGAFGAGISVGVVEMVVSTPALTPDVDMVEVVINASLFGALCGIGVAPLLWWTMLRFVPPWRGAAETALVTSFAAGFTVPITIGNGWSVLAMGIVGAALAVLRLQWEFRARD
jgi:hypothetical protein